MSEASFHVGQLVDIVSYGLGTVTCVSSPDPKHTGRVQVLYDDGTSYWARCNTVRPIYPSKKRLCVSPTTSQYRTAWIHNVTKQDVCLEIGCHEGTTTAMLHRRAKFVVGIDLSSKTIDMARASHKDCRFEVCDGFDTQRLRSFSSRSDGGYDVIGMDIGGIAPLDKVMSLVHTLMQEFRASPEHPRATRLLVKSIHLARFLGIAEVFRFDAKRQWALPPPQEGTTCIAQPSSSAPEGVEAQDDTEASD